MRVILEAGLLVSTQVLHHPLALPALFNLFMDRVCHSIEVDPPEAPEIQAWLSTLSNDIRAEIELVLDESDQRQLRDPSTISIRIADVQTVHWVNDVPRFSLKEATDFLYKPLRVLIEGVNDEAFLKAVVPHFYRARFEEWSRREWLKLEYRGGLPNLQHTIKQERQVRERRLRLFVMIDSDARKRDHPSNDSKEVARMCKRSTIAHHQLARRAIENYLPEPALERWLNRKHSRDFVTTWVPRLRAFRELTEEQRHHFNMKCGFKKDREGVGLSDIFDPLVTLKSEHALLLDSGFGEVASCFREESIPDAWRVADGQHGEMMELFGKMLGTV